MADAELHILVIDDDEHIRRLLTDILTREGHQTVSAASAEEGLELLPYWTFQVAFLDQRLPGMDGLVLGQYLRRNNPDMMIALVSGEDPRSLLKRSRELAITVIEKPFEVPAVLRVLDDYRELAKERKEQRLRHEDADYEPPIARFADDVTLCYGIPKVPARIEARVVETLKRCLNNLRSVSRYSERDRVIALSGLLSARVLGLELPKTGNGKSLFEEYDDLMRMHGRRPEFDNE